MSRLHFKGGAWTNAEDQVLKAALAEYGLRDWERVASMLTKKTATQCRERWESYLDPRLNIHEAWSVEEEEKLVEMQSLFPNKWRLIADQLTRSTPNHYRRPPWLCEQRYLELKDEQEFYTKKKQQEGRGLPRRDGDDGGEEEQSLESFMAERRRRRGAQKSHEERAARADTASGDIYEKEMLSMATSRLANQDQKKGLRKERQRQLEEAAFLAKLESNREGIESGTLSSRQAKKMKKALEEDRRGRGGEEGEEGAPDQEDNEDEDGDEENSSFEAIDMYEDQAQAGLEKKQRILMKDISGQQNKSMQQLVDGQLDGDASGAARHAFTGINVDLLKQLADNSNNNNNKGLDGLIADGEPGASSGEGLGLGGDGGLDDLFGDLPDVVHTISVKQTNNNNNENSNVKASVAPVVPLVKSPERKREREEEVLLDLPPPLPSAPTAAAEMPTSKKTKAEEKEVVVATPEAPPVPLQPLSELVQERVANTAWDDAAAGDRLRDAQTRVAIACEQLAVRQRWSFTPSSSSLLDVPPEKLQAATQLVDHAMKHLFSTPPVEPDQVAEENVTLLKERLERVPAVETQTALHTLEKEVGKLAAAANHVLGAARTQVRQVLGGALVPTDASHCLHGFLDDEGRLCGSTAAGDEADHEEEEGETGHRHYQDKLVAEAMVMDSVYEYWTAEEARLRQALDFLTWWRAEEQAEMRRRLDGVQHALAMVQARERVLQDEYKQKQMRGK